jgi:hypothetical protein
LATDPATFRQLGSDLSWNRSGQAPPHIALWLGLW